MRNGYRSYLWAAIVALGGFLFGVDATVISGVIGFVTNQFGLTDWQIGLVVSAPTLMSIPAALTVSSIADYVGRKKVLIVLAALYSISAVGAALAQDFWGLVIARAIGGYAFGALGLAPIYISEIAPARQRGTLVSFNQLNIILGFSAAYFANYYILQLSQSGSPWVATLHLQHDAWRYMLGVAALPSILWFFLLFGVPESPRWLAMRGYTDRARAIFARYLSAEDMAQTFAEVSAQAEGAALSMLGRLSKLFAPSLGYVLLVGAILGVSQQITGINAVYFYAPTIFEQSGVGTNAAFAQAILIGVVNVVFTVLAMLVIDRLGRRPMMIIGIIGVTLSMATIAYGFSQARYSLPSAEAQALASEHHLPQLTQVAGKTYTSDVAFKNDVRALIGDASLRANEAVLLQKSMKVNPQLILFGILGFVAAFAFSLGPVMWVMLPEIFPNSIRGFGMALMGTINSVVSFGVQFLFPIQLNHLGSMGTFGLYGAFGLVFLVLFLKFLPETRGRSLEELEGDLAR